MTITAREAEKIIEAREGLGQLYEIEQNFKIMISLYKDFESTIFDLTLDALSEPFRARADFTSELVKVNQRLFSFMTAAGMYHDIMNRIRCNTNKELSQCITDAQKYFSKEYDSRLNYRLLEALRNVAKHERNVVTTIKHDRYRDRSSSQPKIEVNPHIKVSSALLRTLKSQVRKELQSGKIETVNAKEMVREYMEALAQCHHLYLQNTEKIVSRIRKVYEAAWEKYPHKDVGNNTFCIVDKTDEDGKFIGIETVVELERFRNAKSLLLRPYSTLISVDSDGSSKSPSLEH
ncbi:MAG: hypothetical protein AAGF76_07020 [Pseudomonadota bacterium]